MKLDSPVTKISGPPGTGKTTHQLDIVMDLLNRGVQPERIIFTTYTRAGAYEARDRACARFGLDAEQFKHFTTIHALCYRRLGKGNILTRPDLQLIGEKLGLQFTWQSPYVEGGLPLNLKGDHFIQMLALSRMKMIPLAEVHRDYDGCNVHFSELKRFADFYENYRSHHRKIDFTDMMENFLREDMTIDADYLIVDEAQDLCLLQWQVIKRLSKNMKHTFVSGDDDQCIHVWAGADPKTLIELEGDHKVLPKSYRIPRSVHTLAHQIIHRVPNRLQKVYEPKTETGNVSQVSSVEAIDLSQPGTWLLLSRNKFFGAQFEDLCTKKGMLYDGGMDRGDSRELAQKAIITWAKLIHGNLVLGSEAKNVYKFLKNRDRVKHGSKKKLNEEIDDSQPIDLKTLKDEYGLLCQGGWEEAFITLTPELKAFFHSAQQLCAFDEPPRIRISTIHGAKGQEADNVAIIPDMTYRTWNGYRNDRDNEHRVAYVAATRAKENLVIIRPQTNKYYEFTT